MKAAIKSRCCCAWHLRLIFKHAIRHSCRLLLTVQHCVHQGEALEEMMQYEDPVKPVTRLPRLLLEHRSVEKLLSGFMVVRAASILSACLQQLCQPVRLMVLGALLRMCSAWHQKAENYAADAKQRSF